jgi:hypothetical protein
MIGTRFGRLVVFEVGPALYARRTKSWTVRCDCGRTKTVAEGSLVRGRTTSCGCARAEANSARNRTHGLSQSPEYRVWTGMKSRCQNPAERAYEGYGGRGILVCERWQKFENFLADMGPRPSPRHTIERRDVNGHYEPGNCMWLPAPLQARNKRDNRRATYRGLTASIAEICERFGADARRTYWRLARGWSIADAIERPPRIWPNQHHRRAT